MVGVTLSFILMMLGFVSFDIIPAPVSYELMVAAWLLMMWFAFGLSLAVAPIISQSQNLSYIWIGISIVLFFLSGSFYLLDWLPAKLQAILIWNPILSGTEMLRHGYFGDSIKTFEEPFYLIKWNLALTLLGLYMVRSKFLLNQSS
jgi:capsular polysaccharide transport system permease protein